MIKILEWGLAPGMRVRWSAIDPLDKLIYPGPPREFITDIRAFYDSDEPGPSLLRVVRNDNLRISFQMIGDGIKYAYAKHIEGEDFIRLYGDMKAWKIWETSNG